MVLSLGSCSAGALAGCGIGLLCSWPQPCRGRARRKGAPAQLARGGSGRSQVAQSPSELPKASRSVPIERGVSLRDRLLRTLTNEAARADEFGAELVNDVVAKKWPYISEWFGDLLHELVGPMIKSRCRGHAELTDCHLGNIPGEAITVVSTSFLQAWPGELDEQRQSVRFVADFTYRGDGIIGVQTTAGKVEFSPKMSGTLVVELVKQTRLIPWFTGLRVYFPDKPNLQFEDFKRPGFLDTAAYMFTGTGLDELVLESVKEVMCRKFVLPNCFAAPILPTADLDPVLLQNLRPRGVMRVSMPSFSKPSAEEPTAEVSWMDYLLRGRPELDSPEPVQVQIGAHSVILHPGDTHDFILNEGSWKHIYIMLHDRPDRQASGNVTVALDRMLLEQGLESASTFQLLLPKAGSTSGFRTKYLEATWRPFTSDVDTELQDARFLEAASASEAADGAWALVVDLCHVVGLPSSHSGVLHWATIQILGSEHASAGALAAAPRDHCRDVLRDIYRMPSSALNELAESGLGQRSWHRLLSRDGLGDAVLNDDAVDVFWDQSLCVLLQRNMPGDVLSGKHRIAIQLWRSGSAASDDTDDSPRLCFASATHPLESLLELEGHRKVLNLRLEAGPDAGSELGQFLEQGSLKVGLQLCPLKRNTTQTQGQRVWGNASP